MSTSQLPLGRHVEYPRRYDAGLLFPIPRAQGREGLGLTGASLPFVGVDRWHAYELSWLDARGKPQVATATFEVPASSPNLVESKSLKLYLSSFSATRFESSEAVRARMREDVSRAAGAEVSLTFGLPRMCTTPSLAAESLDTLELDIEHYGPPRSEFLSADETRVVSEVLTSELLKSNCPVTGQPDWATVEIRYEGPKLQREGLLRYLVSFRDHAEFHEQCVERIFIDLRERARPKALSVEARYTRRGGLDINPWRATAGFPRPEPTRDERQ